MNPGIPGVSGKYMTKFFKEGEFSCLAFENSGYYRVLKMEPR
jgi:hypothetical protein